MKKQTMKKESTMNLMNNSLIDLPTPSNISYLWNMGSMMATTMILQIITGLVVSMHYTTEMSHSFESVIKMTRNMETGHMMRTIHATGASLFFILIYIHMMRGLFFSAPNKNTKTWSSGMVMLIMLMATAFLGYVLPWGQMSFWGATVITNIFSAIPYLGKSMVEWMWGGFSVSQPTLTRFFSLHFMIPLAIAMMSMIHLMLLHETGSSNPLSSNSSQEKSPFHPFFSSKDSTPLTITMVMMLWISSNNPNELTDPENYSEANPLTTPKHIQPEWYFLFAYAILRSIPSKLGGVIALISSLMIMMLPTTKKNKPSTNKFNPQQKATMIFMLMTLTTLTWLGANPVEPPYEMTGQFQSTLYFMTMIML